MGHGRSRMWEELKPLLRTKGFDHQEFNSHPPAGQTAKERLERMLAESAYALLVLTAEDEHGDGSLHARENVIHEAGLFQGRLGFQRAIILVEDGCSTFSNIAGLQTINFKRGDVGSAVTALRRQLEYWNQIERGDDGRFSEQDPDPFMIGSLPRDPKPSVTFAVLLGGALATMIVITWLRGSTLGWHMLYAVPSAIGIMFGIRWALNRIRESRRSRRVRRLYSHGRRPFRDKQLTRAVLNDIVLAGADFSQSILYRAVLTRTDLREARLRETDLREAQMEAINAERADFSKAALNGAYLATSNLRGAILKGATLVEAYLSRAVCEGASLQETDLRGANLQHAVLRGADLRWANLCDAVLAHADLRGADLRHADLRGADLLGADLRGAKVTLTDLADCALEHALLDAPVVDTPGQRQRESPEEH